AVIRISVAVVGLVVAVARIIAVIARVVVVVAVVIAVIDLLHGALVVARRLLVRREIAGGRRQRRAGHAERGGRGQRRRGESKDLHGNLLPSTIHLGSAFASYIDKNAWQTCRFACCANHDQLVNTRSSAIQVSPYLP